MRIWEAEGTMLKAERDAVIAALEHCGYHPAAAARRLCVGRSTVYRMVDAFEIPLRKPPARRR
jgi:transcriptional regulator of acetoin/glycerol metabolism